MSDFAGLVADLAELYPDAHIAAWLATVHPVLRRTPLDCIRAGDSGRVREIVARILDTAYV
jgi:hypothetical protein